MKHFFFYILLLGSTFHFGQTAPYRAVMFNGTGANTTDKLTALALAGIVNRDSARLYLLNVYETWSFNQTDETWRNLYRTRGNVQFDSMTSIAALINRFRPFLQGAVTYDLYRFYSNFSGQSFNYQGEVAAMIGGLTNRLPLSASQASTYGLAVSDSVLVSDAFDGDPPVYVPGKLESSAHPWNNTSLSEEERYFRLLEYCLGNLLPRCNPSKFYIREITDFAVQQRMFQVNLAGTSDLDLNSMPVRKADILENILNYLHSKNPTTIFHIFGWIRPEPMTQWFAQFGSSFHETLLGNLSWHSSFPVVQTPLKPASAVNIDTVTLRNSHYLIFISTEGDAANWTIGLQSGAWLSASRGTVPVAWGWNMYLLSLCPFVAKYYYESATANDGFISVTSPLGYAYPDLWGNDVWGGAVDSTRKLMRDFSVHEVYAYKHYAGSGTMVYRGKTINNSFNFAKLGAFQRDIGAGVTFLFDPLLASQTPYTNYGGLLFNHVNDGTFYGDAGNLNTMASNILNLLKNKPKPHFLLAGYQRFRQDNFSSRTDPSSVDINMPRLQQLSALLRADTSAGKDIAIVTPQYFSALLRKKLGLPNDTGEITPGLPADMLLMQNYPNPFNPVTTIAYRVGSGNAGLVSLKIFDMLGSEIATLVNGEQAPGNYTVAFDASGLPSGIYLYRLTTPGFSQIRKMILIR